MEKFTCDHNVKEAEELLNERNLEPQEKSGAVENINGRAAQNTYTNAVLKEANG